jgi:hypothetical protein
VSRYDTTPTDDDRAYARDQLQRCGGYADVRQAYVLGAVGIYLRMVTEVDDPADARLVARGRALFDAYLEETHE